MKVYQVIEYLTQFYKVNGSGENASGIFSSKEKAKEAIINRLSEDYTTEEIDKIDVSWNIDTYGEVEAPETEQIFGTTYVIFEYELDANID